MDQNDESSGKTKSSIASWCVNDVHCSMLVGDTVVPDLPHPGSGPRHSPSARRRRWILAYQISLKFITLSFTVRPILLSCIPDAPISDVQVLVAALRALLRLSFASKYPRGASYSSTLSPRLATETAFHFTGMLIGWSLTQVLLRKRNMGMDTPVATVF